MGVQSLPRARLRTIDPLAAVIDVIPFRKDVLVMRAMWTGD
ncbi:MAG TPA: hypothetical protein VFK43_16170 [Acidimicrobiales bacterium]|nr:hypothetical protein [Acidimicrobiales bacterium]